MLSFVQCKIPELYADCRSAYGQPSFSVFGPYTVSSQAQQGDPLEPLLFSNTVHPMLSSLQAELKLGYLDDITSGGSVETVAFDVAEIMMIGAEIGLSLNVSKATLKASLIFARRRASFPATSSQHSGAWLFALPISSCRLRLDDEAVRVAVGLWLG